MARTSEQVGKDSISRKLEGFLSEALNADCPHLIETPPGTNRAELLEIILEHTEQQVTYLTSRIERFEAIQSAGEDQFQTTLVLPSPYRDCPTFRGENDGDQSKAHKLYRRGVSAREIHQDQNVDTPCDADEDDSQCSYLVNRKKVNSGLNSGTIDILIGHHKHAFQSRNFDGRVVIIDRFDPDDFLSYFPNRQNSERNQPDVIISQFLEYLGNHLTNFPSHQFGDVTDLIQHRADEEALENALTWFEEYGARWDDVRQNWMIKSFSQRYGDIHRVAPQLTMALLCMRKVSPGWELAPPPDHYEVPRVRKAWDKSGLGSVRCLRNRNSGEICLLRLPDLSAADQIVGIDELATKRLWDLLCPNGGFERHQIIERQEIPTYLRSVLKTSVYQLGKGDYRYSRGRISQYDQHRFAAISAIERGKFALISTAKALAKYNSDLELETWVKSRGDCQEGPMPYSHLLVDNFESVLGSERMRDEPLGVISGAPFAGTQVMELWLGLFGESVEFEDELEDNEFEDVAEDIFDYLSGHRVVRAIFSFANRTGESQATKVYVNSKALPSWFKPEQKFTVGYNNKSTKIIEFLIHVKRLDSKEFINEQNVASIHEHLSDDEFSIHEDHIRHILNLLDEAGHVSVRSEGVGGSALYEWDGTESLGEVRGLRNFSHALKTKSGIYLLRL